MATLGEAAVEIVADTSALEDLSSATQDALSDVTGAFDGLSDVASQSADGVADAFVGGAEGTAEAFGDAAVDVGESFDDIGLAGDGAADEVADAFDGVSDEIADAFDDAADSAVDAFDEMGDAAADAADDIDDIGDAAESVEQVGESADSAGDDLAGFGDTAADAASEAESGFSSLLEVFAGVQLATMAVDQAKSILQGTISGLVTSTADFGDEIAKTSVRLGIAEADLQGLQFAGELAGIATSDMESALRRMNLQLGEASLEGGTAAQRFSDLGVSIHDVDGNLRSTGDVFVDVIDSVSELGSAAEQSAALGEIFGRRYGTELLTLLEEGGDGIREQMELLAELGGVMDEDATAASERFNDQLLILRTAFSALRRRAMMPFIETMADSLLPRLTEGVVAFGGFIDEIREAESAGERLQITWDRIGPAVSEALSGIRDAAVEQVRRARDWLAEGGAETIAGAILGWRTRVMEAITTALGSMTEALEEHGEELTEEAVGELAEPLADAIVGLAEDALEAFVDMFEAALDFADELEPHLEAAAAIIVEQLGQMLVDLSPSLGQAFGRMLVRAVDTFVPTISTSGLREGFEGGVLGEIGPALVRIGTAITGFFVGVIASVVDALRPEPEDGEEIEEGFTSNIIPGFERFATHVERILQGVSDDGWSGMWEAMQDAWSEVGLGLVIEVEERFPEWSSRIQTALTNLQNAWDTFWATLDKLWNETGPNMLSSIERRFEEMRTRLSTTWRIIQTVVRTTMDIISGIIRTILAVITGDWETAHNELDGVTSTIWSTIGTTVDRATGGLLSTITGFLSETLSSWRETWNEAETRVREAWEEIRREVESRAEDMLSFIRGLPQKMKDALFDAIEKLKERGREIMQGMRDGLSERFERVTSFLTGLPARIRSAIPSPSEILSGIGRSIMSGLWSGMRDFFNNHVAPWLRGLASRMAEMKGPLSADRVLLTDQGRAIMHGFHNGLQDGYRVVEGMLGRIGDETDDVWARTVQGVTSRQVVAPWRQVTDNTVRETDTLHNEIRRFLDDLTRTWSDGYRLLVQVAQDAMDDIIDAFERGLSGVQRGARALFNAAVDAMSGLPDRYAEIARSAVEAMQRELDRAQLRPPAIDVPGVPEPPGVGAPGPGEQTALDRLAETLRESTERRRAESAFFDPERGQIVSPALREVLDRRESSVTVNVSGAAQPVSEERITTLIRRSQTLEGTR